MKRLNLILLFIICSTLIGYSQIFVDNQGNIYDQREIRTKQRSTQQAPKSSKSSSFDKRKLEFGGNLGLQFGDHTLINISPQVGYQFSKYFSAGAGIGYTYYNYDKYRNNYTEHFASFNLYGNIYPVSFLVLSVKPEISRVWISHEVDQQKYTDNKFVPSIVVGGGVRFINLTLQIKYDLVQDDYSPYGDTIFYSIGYTFGL